MLTGKAKTDYQREYMRKYRKTHPQKRGSKTLEVSKTQDLNAVMYEAARLAFSNAQRNSRVLKELTYERDDYSQ